MQYKTKLGLRFIASSIAIGGSLLSLAALAQSLSFAQTPLFVSGSADPNIMLMLDNSGSMSNIVPEDTGAPGYSSSVTTLATCPSGNTVPNSQAIDLNVRSGGNGNPYIFYSNANYLWGTGTNQRCFNPSVTYNNVRLNADNTATVSVGSVNYYNVGSGYLGTSYSGNYLNWYFKTDSVTGVTWNGGNAQRVKPLVANAACPGNGAPSASCVGARIQIARNGAANLVNSLDSRLRVGFATYNSGAGGSLLDPVGPLTATNKRSNLVTTINSLTPTGTTPLAETLEDIGRYFANDTSTNATTAGNRRLTLHPDASNEATATVSTIFNANHQLAPGSGINNTQINTAPIILSCQRSFAVLLTDGRPQSDRAISASLADYIGDCAAGRCDATRTADGTNDTSVAITSSNYRSLQNGVQVGRSYEGNGSDFLDDVARGLADMDLRPDFANETSTGTQFKNNVVTYFIGFADPAVQNDPLLSSAAVAGGGGSIRVANDSASLASTFASIVSSILETSGSFSSVASNSTRLNTGTKVIQASFNSGNWTGELNSFPVSNGVNACASGGGTPAIGELCNSEWSAAPLLNNNNNRKILTYNPSTRTGVPFQWTNLTSTQQSLLGNGSESGTTLTTNGTARLNFLRGNRSTEGNTVTSRTRGGVLGDIVDSSPFYVGPPSFNYGDAGYSAFRRTYSSRTPMIYVGANDGMLHGFNATTGAETIAYVPNDAFGSSSKKLLFNLTQAPFVHAPIVDGSPTIGDAYIGSAWKSVLVAGLNAGGRGIYALDVTDPSTFAETTTAAASTALWEFTDSDDADLGYTYSQPSIVKMANGKWAAIIGNGYTASGETGGNGQASLYILFLDGPNRSSGWGSGSKTDAASRYIKLSTGVGASASPNGLATPAAVDINNDGAIDYIYAGDQRGNLWRFDVKDVNPSNWVVGNSGSALFTATDGTTAQPITERPEVGYNLLASNPTSTTSPQLAIYFGTGRYLDVNDPTTTGVQSFYGIFDKFDSTPATISRSTNLVRQTITQEVGRASNGTATACTGSAIAASGSCYRLTSNNPVTSARYGWFIDLYNTASGNTATSGERQITTPILRGGRIIFTTLIPSTDSCTPGGGGWLMELSARDGKSFDTPVFDVNNDRVIDDQDTITITLADGSTVKVPASGVRSNVGIPTTPDILTISGNREIKYRAGSGRKDASGNVKTLETLVESSPGRQGRITWREINQ